METVHTSDNLSLEPVVGVVSTTYEPLQAYLRLRID